MTVRDEALGVRIENTEQAGIADTNLFVIRRLIKALVFRIQLAQKSRIVRIYDLDTHLHFNKRGWLISRFRFKGW